MIRRKISMPADSWLVLIKPPRGREVAEEHVVAAENSARHGRREMCINLVDACFFYAC